MNVWSWSWRWNFRFLLSTLSSLNLFYTHTEKQELQLFPEDLSFFFCHRASVWHITLFFTFVLGKTVLNSFWQSFSVSFRFSELWSFCGDVLTCYQAKSESENHLQKTMKSFLKNAGDRLRAESSITLINQSKIVAGEQAVKRQRFPKTPKTRKSRNGLETKKNM